MYALAFLSLLLAPTSWAAPTAQLECSGCSIANAKVSAGSLPAQTASTSFIALGVGTQNYTCKSGAYASAGAYAELFDISCLYGKPYFTRIADDAIKVWNAAPPSLTAARIGSLLAAVRSPVLLGEHYFITNPLNASAGISPKWDFTSKAFKGNSNAFVVAAKSANVAAITGTQDVDWLYLKQVQGSLASEIYRTDTRLGQPPTSCTGTETTTVKYVSIYWLTGGSVKKSSA